MYVVYYREIAYGIFKLATLRYCTRATLAGIAQDERALHQRFKDDRIRGEWFRPSPALMHYISTLPSNIEGSGLATPHVSHNEKPHIDPPSAY